MYIVIKLGNKLIYNFSMIIWGMGIVLFSFLIIDSFLVFIYLVVFFLGSGYSGVIMILWNVLLFVLDVDEMIMIKRREGVYVGLMLFI